MRKFPMPRWIATLFCAALLSAGNSATAVPTVLPYIQESYGDNEQYREFYAKYTSQRTKCDMCHVIGVGKSRSDRSLTDFGRAFRKHFQADALKAARKAEDEAAARRIFTNAWRNACDERNAAGEKYGDRIQAGNLPVETPE